MADNERPKLRGNDTGPTALEVGRNLKRIRASLGMGQRDVSKALEVMGRPIPVASIGRIEAGDRRVEVDDLMALSIVLRVSPLALLLPYTREPSDDVEVTGAQQRAIEIWDWAVGSAPWELDGDVDDIEHEVRVFRHASLPWWLDVSTTATLNKSSGSYQYATKAWDRDAREAAEDG